MAANDASKSLKQESNYQEHLEPYRRLAREIKPGRE